MLNKITTYYNSKQGILPIFISDFLDICDPVLSFDKFMEGINLNKYLKKYQNMTLEELDIILSICLKLCSLAL